MFVLEGIPAIALAVVTWFAMADRPQQAAWLTEEERDCILRALETERREKSISPDISIWDALRSRNVLLLAAVGFLANIGISGFFLWLPTTLHKASTLSPAGAAALSGIPFASAVLAVLGMSYSSDRSRERRLHTAIPLILAAAYLSGDNHGQPQFCWAAVLAFAVGGRHLFLRAILLDDPIPKTYRLCRRRRFRLSESQQRVGKFRRSFGGRQHTDCGVFFFGGRDVSFSVFSSGGIVCAGNTNPTVKLLQVREVRAVVSRMR